MKNGKWCGILLAITTFCTASDASAGLVDYTPNFPVSEINATKGAGRIHSMLAAGLMAVKGFSNTVIEDKHENELLEMCKLYSPPGTSWPDSCDILGLAKALTDMFPGNWVKSTWPGTDAGQQAAMNVQLTGMSVYKSPSIVPLYGQVDHWGTVIKIRADKAVNPWLISRVWFYDAGDPVFEDGDIEGNGFEDGLKQYSGAVYKTTYYKIFAPGAVSPLDPYYGKYIFAYEPPVQPAKFDMNQQLEFAAGIPILGEGERLTPSLASDLVWDALELDDVLEGREYQRIVDAGVAGQAVEVHGFTPTGAPWNYFVVPIHDSNRRGVLALVGLAAEDGAFEQIRSFNTPQAFSLRNAREASVAARGQLSRGESLAQGELRWDPRCGDVYCRSPELPYYEYAVVDANRQHSGRVIVPIQGGAALRRR